MNTPEPTPDAGAWRQVNVAFPAWATAEQTALDHLVPLMTAAETDGLIDSWFFLRKTPCWRVRYQPVSDDPAHAETQLLNRLSPLAHKRIIGAATVVIYEPETHAFGGPAGMAIAHRLFHLDSRHLLTHLTRAQHRPEGRHRRELSVLLCTALLRGAGLDWYEQGDVWARVAVHREPPALPPADRLDQLQADLRRLIGADPTHLTLETSPQAFLDGWAEAFTAAGRDLAALATAGRLHRGLRAILAHKIIFAWNRHGLPARTQTILANTAKIAVFGPDPTSEHPAPVGT
jgi:thiopeptide-type bacteriocin biosynthesis protein